MRIILLLIYITLSPLAIFAQSESSVGKRIVKRSENVDYAELLKRRSFMVARDSLYDISSLSYARMRNYNLLLYKTSGQQDSVKLLKIYKKWRVERLNVPIHSDAQVKFIHNKRGWSQSNIVIMTYGKEPFRTIISDDNAKSWSHNSNNIPYIGSSVDGSLSSSQSNTIVYFSDKEGRHIADDSLHTVIYQMSSKDSGYSWEPPQVAVKHNLYSVSDPYVYTNDKLEEPNIMIMQGRDYIPMISYNDGQSREWSYPEEMDETFRGDMHKILVCKNFIFIMFRQRGEDGSIGSVVLWKGSIHDFNRNGKGSMIYITSKDNVDNSKMNNNDLAFVPTLKGNIFILCSTKWESDIPSYAIGYKIRKRDVKKGKFTI